MAFVLIPSWVGSQQPDCGHCASVIDTGCVPGSWQTPGHPLLESQHGFGGKSGVTRQSLLSCPCSEEPIPGFSYDSWTCLWNGGCQLWLAWSLPLILRTSVGLRAGDGHRFPLSQTLTAVSGAQFVLPLTCHHSRMLSALQHRRLHSVPLRQR